jgi:glutathione S-transferase
VHPAAVIVLHTFPGRPNLESLSPFCAKVEAYLKLAGLPYRAELADPRKAPKGKLPYIVDDDGTKVADSGAIVAYLEKKHSEPLDKGLSEHERARAHVIRRTFEESLYFVMLWSRWAEEEGWRKVSSKYFDALPAPLRLFVPAIVRKKVVGASLAQGIGRHSRDEIYAWGNADLAAVSTLLGDGPFAIDSRLRTVDVTMYAFVANAVRVDVDTPIRAYLEKDGRLVAHMERVADAIAKKKPDAKATAA